MIQFGNILKTDCISCKEQCSHVITYTGNKIHHFHCSACGAVNAYFLEESAGKKKKSNNKGVEYLDYEALTKLRGSKPFNVYSATQAFTDGQYIKHPKFGEGYVLAVSSPPTKMEVFFADQRRMLACGPGSTSGAPKAKPSSDSSEKPSKASPPPKAKRVKAPKTKKLTSTHPSDEPVECPKCGQVVHPYNIDKNPQGRIVGCMRCK
ncbi:MAG: hypothetical protein GY847_31660 [Proteobacteria bacterium]|nr:hypothetical protein [Pseudomonadota bacterium]